jgi:hypothetical protein
MSDLRVRTLGPVVLIAAACLGVAGCGSSGSAPTAGTANYSSASAAAEAQQAGDTAHAVDACALVSKEEVATLIGVTVDGVASGHGATTACMWENPDTYESVTIDIGAPGTAVDDTLPALSELGLPDVESTPGPDGTRILAGAVEFAAGTRYNSVQVATPVTMSSDQSVAAALDLIGKIKPQIPE